MDENSLFTPFDEIEVSKDGAKCKLAEKWLQKTAVDSELQVNENDTQIHIKGREFAYTIDKRTALFTEMKFAGREYLNHPMELNIWRAPLSPQAPLPQEAGDGNRPPVLRTATL